MRVGDLVRISGDATHDTWRIVNTKSDFRAFWIQLDRAQDMPDVWYDSRYFEVISENL